MLQFVGKFHAGILYQIFHAKIQAGIIYQFTKISYLNIHAVFLNKNSSYTNWYNIPKTLEQISPLFFSKFFVGILFHEFINEILSYTYTVFYIKILIFRNSQLVYYTMNLQTKF